MPVLVGSGSTTLVDFNDVNIQTTQPTNPTDGMLWLDTSGTAPFQLYIYKSSKWEPTTHESLQSLDSTAYQQVQDAYNGIKDLDADNKITRYERSVVRGEIYKITGVHPTTAMPTIAAIDSGAKGDLYALRKQARDVGILTTDTKYTATGTAYTALATYLGGLSPKGWDISSDSVATTTGTAWDTAWNNYYVAVLNLRVAIDIQAEKNLQDVADDVDTISGNYTLLEERVSTAEEKITDDSIVQTVTKSTTWSTVISDVSTANTNASNAVSTANTANTNASTAVSTANTAKSTADTAKSIANTASTNASNAVSTANTANTNASNAVSTANAANTAATAAQNAVNDMLSDLKITSLEKEQLSREWAIIQAEQTQLAAQADSLSVARTAYNTAYNNLNGVTPKIASEILANMSTTYTFASTTARDNFKTKITTYYTEAEKLRKAINDKINSTASTAASNASTAVSTANTAKSTAESAASTASSAASTANAAQSTAETAAANASTAVSTANTAKSTADTAKSTADTAKSTADSKAKTFTSQPAPPYKVGDIWKNGQTVYVCKTDRSTGSYTSSDWEKVGDVTSLNTAADTAKVAGVSATTVKDNAANGATAKTTLDQNKNKWDTAATDATNANTKIDNLKLGGRNLLYGSAINVNNANYPTQIYSLTEPIPNGAEVTVSIKGTLNRTSWGLYNSGGSVSITSLTASDKGADGIFRKTFNWVVGTSNNTKLYLYAMPNSDTDANQVEWIMLEYGNRASDWSPAPEEIQAAIDGKAPSGIATTITEEYNAAIDQRATDITQTLERKITDSATNITNAYRSEISSTADIINLSISQTNERVDGLNSDVSEIRTNFTFSEEDLRIGKTGSPFQVSIDNEYMQFLAVGGDGNPANPPNPDAVAWINGMQMYIRNIEVKQSMIIGKHQIESNGDLTLVRFIG